MFFPQRETSDLFPPERESGTCVFAEDEESHLFPSGRLTKLLLCLQRMPNQDTPTQTKIQADVGADGGGGCGGGDIGGGRGGVDGGGAV